MDEADVRGSHDLDLSLGEDNVVEVGLVDVTAPTGRVESYQKR